MEKVSERCCKSTVKAFKIDFRYCANKGNARLEGFLERARKGLRRSFSIVKWVEDQGCLQQSSPRPQLILLFLERVLVNTLKTPTLVNPGYLFQFSVCHHADRKASLRFGPALDMLPATLYSIQTIQPCHAEYRQSFQPCSTLISAAFLT